ncbi:MAG: hypothetical protein AAFX40_01805 [Cyanobacteria bacterium J06639_1]
MTSKRQSEVEKIQDEEGLAIAPASVEKILCTHCKRTATNGIKCRGFCVADSDY